MKKMLKMLRFKLGGKMGEEAGFTVLELVVSMLMISILVGAIGIGVYLGYTRQAKKTEMEITFGHLRTALLKLNTDTGMWPTTINSLYCDTVAAAELGTGYAKWDADGYWRIPDACVAGTKPLNQFGGFYDITSAGDLNGDGTIDVALVATMVEPSEALKYDKSVDKTDTPATGYVTIDVDPADANRRRVFLIVASL